MTTFGFLGLGEAGAHIAGDLAAAGAAVRGYDPQVRGVPGVTDADDPAGVATGADVVLSLNSAADALDAARSVAGTLRPGQVYAEANTASPGRKQEVAAVLGEGVLVADVAIMQPVPGRGVQVPALASGPGAERFLELLEPWGMPVALDPGGVGAAAARKLARSVFFKGLAAAVGEALAAGRALDCEDWLRADVGATLAGFEADAVDRLVDGSLRHAVRRSHEMEAATAMLDELGVPARVASASRDWLQELAAS